MTAWSRSRRLLASWLCLLAAIRGTAHPRTAVASRRAAAQSRSFASPEQDDMATKKIGVIGSGTVGETLANGFLKHGYEVMRGSREPKKLAPWREQAGPRAQIG